MGKITRSLFLFLFLSLAGFISSCVSDVEIDSSNNVVGRTNGPPTVDEAKALLASCGELSLPNLRKNIQKGIQVRAIGKLKYDPTAVVPDWAVTQTFTEDDATILMIPLEIAAPISGITRTFVDGKESREAVQVYSKLLVKKNSARQMLGVIVTYLPDRKYWEEDGCDINKLGYELGGTNYSGIYMVSSLDGTLIHGAKFDKGELLFRFYPNWRKDMDKEHECQHADSAGHEACEHDASQAKYKLNIELLDARHNVLSRSRSTEGENFICSFCGRNAMDCNCLTIEDNYICSVCHNEIVNGRCRCCSVCRNSPCRCCYTCRNYPCTCPSSGGNTGGSTGGGSTGGGSTGAGGGTGGGSTGGGGGSDGGGTPPPSNITLPPLNTITAKFNVVAKISPIDVAKLIGGNVLLNFQNNPGYFSNGCTIRLSYALNLCDKKHEISYVKGKTISGDCNQDGVKEWYYYRVADMIDYLDSKYGPHEVATLDEITGKTGIVGQTDCGWGAGGHVDIWDNTNTLSADGLYPDCETLYVWDLK